MACILPLHEHLLVSGSTRASGGMQSCVSGLWALYLSFALLRRALTSLSLSVHLLLLLVFFPRTFFSSCSSPYRAVPYRPQTFEHLNGIGTDGRSYTWEARNSTDENGSTIHSVRCAIDNLTKTSWCVRPAGHSEDVPRTIKYSSSANRDVFEQQWRLNAPFFLLVKDAEECDRCLAAGAAPVSLEGGEKK